LFDDQPGLSLRVGWWEIRDDGHALTDLSETFCEQSEPPPVAEGRFRETETHTTCYVGHRTDHRCAGMNPGGELRDGDAGKDADEQLADQSLFDPTLVKDGICTLWFATEIYIYLVRRREVLANTPKITKNHAYHSKTTSDCCTAETFSPTVTSIASPPITARNVSRRRLALSSRCTQAMKRDGSVGSSSSATMGVEVPGVWDSHLGWPEFRPCRGLCEWRLASTPDVTAMPIVPHPTGGRNQLVIDTRDGRAHLARITCNP
jgi:hypothetical protein